MLKMMLSDTRYILFPDNIYDVLRTRTKNKSSPHQLLMRAVFFLTSMLQIFINIIIILFLAYLTDYFLKRSVLGRGYRIFVAPGIILHEISHAIACKLTGAKINKISLFDAKGGSVIHTKSKIPIFGQLIISLAPFVAGVIVIYLLGQFIGFSNQIGNIDKHNLINIVYILPKKIDLFKYYNWALIYLILSIIVTMTPSIQDIKHILITLVILGVIIFILVQYTGILSIPFNSTNSLLILIIILLFLALVFSLIIYVLTRLLKH